MRSLLLTALAAVALTACAAAAPKPTTKYMAEVLVSAPDGDVAKAFPIAVTDDLQECKAVILQSMVKNQDAVAEFLQAGGTVRGYCFPIQAPTVTLKPSDLKADPQAGSAATHDEPIPGQTKI